jgi:hypothetical protein
VAEENVVDAEAGFFTVAGAGEAEATGGVGLGIAVDEKGWEAFEGDGGGEVDGGGGFTDSALLVDNGDDLGWGCYWFVDWVSGDHRRRRRVSGGGDGGNVDGLCRSAGGCGELVECCFSCWIAEVWDGWVWKTIVPRGTISGSGLIVGLDLREHGFVPRGTNPSKRSEQKPNLVVETKQNDDRHHDGAEQYLYDVIVEDLLVGVWGVESLEFLRIETFAGYYVSGYYGVGGGCGLLCVRFHKNSLIETGIGPGSCTTMFMGSSLIY